MDERDGWLRPSLSITGRITHQLRKARAIQRGRHGEHASRAKRGLRVKSQRQPKSLSRLRSCTSSNSTAETRRVRITWMRLSEDAFGQNQNAGPRGLPAVQPGRVPDGFAPTRSPASPPYARRCTGGENGAARATGLAPAPG
jgi:hypothetical protein